MNDHSNKITLGNRIIRVSVALFLVGLGIYALMAQELSWHRRGRIIHVIGMSKDLAAFALFCAAASLLSVGVFRYRELAEKLRHRMFERLFRTGGIVLLLISVIIHWYQRFQR